MNNKKNTALTKRKRRSTGAITLNDVAQAAGVGSMTVSRALREPDKVSEKLRSKIENAINSLGYKQNAAASELASAQKNNIVIILVHKINEDANQYLIEAIQEHLIDQQCYVIVLEIFRYKDINLLAQTLKKLDPAIISLLDVASHVDFELKKYFDLIGIPILAFERTYNQEIGLGEYNKLAMYHLTAQVIKKGYSQIGLLCAHHQLPILQQRLNGWHKALLDNHLPNHRIINAVKPPIFSTGSELLGDCLLNWPEMDALICTSDELACGVLNECLRRRIKVPLDLAVIGFGDSDCGRVSYPKLTTIKLPNKPLGLFMAEKIMNTIDTPSPTSQTPEIDFEKLICWRQSC